MAWKPGINRVEIRELLTAIDRQAREAVALGERAQRDVGGDRFASYLDFRRKVEEVRALAALTEERLQTAAEARLDELHQEFERMDLVLTRLLVTATRNYFASLRADQVLPVGAHEMFEPERRIIDAMRRKLGDPRYEGKLPASLRDDVEETATMLERILARTPALPDFSDEPSPPRPVRRLANLGRPVRP